MKKITILIALVILPLFNAYAVKLEWDIEKDERIEMIKTAGIRYYVNAGLKRA